MSSRSGTANEAGFGHPELELMIVVAIIGTLAAIAVPSFFRARDKLHAGADGLL